MKELCDYCFCACCLRSVILLSPCHLTLSTTSPALSLSLSIKLSRYLTARIRAADTKICAQLCVQQLWVTLCSLYPWPTFFLKISGLRQMGGFQVMCISICQCVTPTLSFILGWFHTALWIITVITWEECNSFCHVHCFDLWSVIGTDAGTHRNNNRWTLVKDFGSFDPKRKL